MSEIRLSTPPTTLATGLLKLFGGVAMSASLIKVADQANTTSPLRLSTTEITNYGAGDVATNTAFGSLALIANTTGALNTAFGNEALQSNVASSNNSAFGHGAMANNSSGTDNVAIGRHAMQLNTTASSNTAVGSQALAINVSGGFNTAIGHQSLQLSTSINNVAGRNLRINNSAVNLFYTNADNAVLRIYNRALTATEVLQNYNSKKSRFGL